MARRGPLEQRKGLFLPFVSAAALPWDASDARLKRKDPDAARGAEGARFRGLFLG